MSQHKGSNVLLQSPVLTEETMRPVCVFPSWVQCCSSDRKGIHPMKKSALLIPKVKWTKKTDGNWLTPGKWPFMQRWQRLWYFAHWDTHNRFTAFFRRLPSWASARRNLLFDFMVQGKITEADTLTVQLGATPPRLISDPRASSPHFNAGCPSCHNPPTLSWLGTCTKYAGLHTQWVRAHWDNNEKNTYQRCCFADADWSC